MNKSNIFKVILVLIIIFLANKYYKNSNKLIYTEHELQTINNLINSIDGIIGDKYILDGLKLNNDALIQNSKGEKIKLFNVINDNVIIFRLSTNSCNACIDLEVDQLLKAEKKIGSENILILTDYDNFRDNNFLITNDSSNIEVFTVKDDELGLEEKFYDSFVFVTDKSFKIKMPYIPIYFFEENIIKYHQLIIKRFFNQKNPCG